MTMEFAVPTRHSAWWMGTLGAALLLGAASGASAVLQAVGPAEVSFKAATNVVLTVHGRGKELSVSDDGKTIVIRVPLQSIMTGIGLRDRHMREALDVARYPNAELKVARSALVFPSQGSSKSGTASGQLTLHGQTRPAPFSYQAKHEGSAYQVDGALSVDMTDFGIQPPSYAGAKVKPKVDVEVRFRARE